MASMDEPETLTVRQENELELLKSMYPDDVKDLRENDAWKVARAPELLISLKPQESVNNRESHVFVDLHVRCPVNYPEISPSLDFKNVKGLSTQQVAGLKLEVDKLAKSLVGEVMIYELCQLVQTYLHAHNKPPAKSFFDEMLSNKKKKQEREEQDQIKKDEIQKKKEERQAKLIEEEIQKRKDEAKKRRNEAKQLERLSLSESSTHMQFNPKSFLITPIPKDSAQKQMRRRSESREKSPTVQYVDKVPSPKITGHIGFSSTPKAGEKRNQETSRWKHHTGTSEVIFTTKNKETKIQRGKCLGHSVDRGSTVYVGMDSADGELVALSEWEVKWRHANRKLNVDAKMDEEKQAEHFMKQVGTCETELLSLLRLRHQNLTHFRAISYKQQVGKVTINILMEYIGGGNLQQYLTKEQPVSVPVIRKYSSQILEALAYIHNKAVVHRDLRPSSILLDDKGNVRLTDYSLMHRLAELVLEANDQRPGVKFENIPSRPPTLGRGGKKCDVYRLGISLLSLALGYVIEELLPEVPTGFPADFHDFLNKCLIRDERHRWSAHELLDHAFIKTPMVIAPERKATAEPLVEKIPVKEKEDDVDDIDDIPYIPTSDRGSRLKNEFEILKWLGKGGFGDVIKVKNKLDRRNYAIKRIPLKPQNDAFKKKITREVKLLSRLNHENVVRYYNSWIETSDELPETDESTISEFASSSQVESPSKKPDAKSPSKKRPAVDSLGPSSKSAMFPPQSAVAEGSVEWSASGDCKPKDNESLFEDDDDDEDEEDNDLLFGRDRSVLPNSESDDGIVFEQGVDSVDWSENTSGVTENLANDKVTATENASPKKLQFLYIQMEFCEKSTLRNCIDAGLYKETDRMWRLFREIIEGLSHIHEQGMIHRDLKPVNIFLDSNDHVKIGDFGLATTDIISKQQSDLLDITSNPANLSIIENKQSTNESMDEAQGSLTGRVGTALYVAPEIMTTKARSHYNQKVDIYSLGIMFFEMCYRPFTTNMERVMILTNLRLHSIELPDDFEDDDLSHKIKIVKWLLEHDPVKRPTSQELLQSDYLPPPQLEEAELNEVLRSTIANPDSKSFKHMMNAIFSQPIVTAIDFAYDSDLHKVPASEKLEKLCLIQMQVLHRLEAIFTKHGAVQLKTPLLMPKSSLYDNSENYACFMDHCGGLVGLPYDLRVPFARYVAKNNVTHMKRYAIETVFRDNKLYNSHPKESRACSFDIVSSPSSQLIVDAEVICVANEVISEFPAMQQRNYHLRINHVALLKGILLHCGISEDLHQEVCNILSETKVERQRKMQIQTKLCSLSLSEQTVDNLYTIIAQEMEYKKANSKLASVTRAKGLAGSLVKKGLHEMEAILAHAEYMGITLKPHLAPGLVNHVAQFSGVMFQIVMDVKRKKKTTIDILAAGGRYDNLISTFRKPGSPATHQGAVGIIIAFDKIIAALHENESLDIPPAFDILVCSVGYKSMVKEKLAVASSLWNAGLRADVLHDDSMRLEEIQDYYRNSGVQFLVILKGGETGYVRVRTIDKERQSEKKINASELVDFIQQKLSCSKPENVDIGSHAGGNVPRSQGSSSVANVSDSSISSGTNYSHPITFLWYGNSKGKNQRRTYETQIYGAVNSSVHSLKEKCKLEILALELPASVVFSIAGYLEWHVDTENELVDSVRPVVENYSKYKEYLHRVFENVQEKKFEKKLDGIVLYSLKENVFRIVL